MPELPEVETIRRQLEPTAVGRVITRFEVLDSKWTEPEPATEVENAVIGKRIEGVRRRGKYLLFDLDGGRCLIMHLRMTGNLLIGDRPADPRLEQNRPESVRHLRAHFILDDGSEIRFTDPRRFGRGLLLDTEDLEGYLDARLGVEPLTEDLSPAYLAERVVGRRVPLKSFLLDQRHIAGIGNIYADEAMYRAALHPLTQAGSLKEEHLEALCQGVVEALETGLSMGGASIDDYRDAKGERGAMQDEFLVHRREGLPCPSCSEPIERIIVGGRSTYYCPTCQVRLRSLPRRRPAARSGKHSRRRTT